MQDWDLEEDEGIDSDDNEDDVLLHTNDGDTGSDGEEKVNDEEADVHAATRLRDGAFVRVHVLLLHSLA